MRKKTPLLSIKQQQDIRSLAAFRILAGLYIVYDIFSRLQYGRLSLLWYTSIPADQSFLHPDDTPHRSPIHRIWFYRGSESFQLFVFAVTLVLSCMFALGYKCNVGTKTLLWLNVVAMSCRCMPPHDGSDTYLRHLLLWSIQLPVSKVWSLDSYFARKNHRSHTSETKPISRCNRNISPYSYEIENWAAVWGIRLQIVIMYFGTVLHRTVDAYGIWNIHKSAWLPPQLTAVHYALSGSFSTRDCWLGDLVRSTLHLSRFMTMTAMLIETFAPIACLVMSDEYVHIPAFLLGHLHFGLLVLMNLPNWQFVGMLSNVIWIPGWVWDCMQRSLSMKCGRLCSPPLVPLTSESMRKKDLDIDRDGNINTPKVEDGNRRKIRRRSLLSYVFLFYMLYDFSGNRGWIKKVDNGDVGEFLRFSQFWVMFSGPPKSAGHILATGTLNEVENVNIWQWMKDGRIEVVDLESFENKIWTNMTHVYPSPRTERAMSDMSTKDTRKLIHFAQSLCRATPFTHVQMNLQNMQILSPEIDISKRYAKVRNDRSITADC